jgi:NAD(P)-dependent dehydrogenase (short-subunit alcohol dehydrogenase family)
VSRGGVLVTGAAKRLGKASALAAAAAGFDVVIHFNGSQAEAELAAAEAAAHGVKAALVQADLCDVIAAQKLMDRAVSALGAPLTALVNSASIFEHDRIESLEPVLFARAMQVNGLAPAILMQGFSAQLPKAARGSIVNFLDFKLANPYADHFSYTLSKYALQGATEMAARALAPMIRVNAVAPGYALPSPGQSDADFARLRANNPLHYGAGADDVAAAVAYLLTAPAVTGQTIYVDSGLRFETHREDFAFR